MVDDIIYSIDKVRELPAVKKIYDNQFVKSKINQFEKFLLKVAKKAFKPIKRKLTSLNWVLINTVVFAYLLGKADSMDTTFWQIFINDFEAIGLYTIILNIGWSAILGLGEILKVASGIILRVFAILIAVFFVYWLICKVIEFFQKSEGNQVSSFTPTNPS